MKISWPTLPYFSKSFASLVTQRGAKLPTSLVQTTLMAAPWEELPISVAPVIAISTRTVRRKCILLLSTVGCSIDVSGLNLYFRSAGGIKQRRMTMRWLITVGFLLLLYSAAGAQNPPRVMSGYAAVSEV